MAYRILFVCLGNICRSPSAENIMKHLVAQRGLTDQIVCDSAGTSDYHIGEPPDPRMTEAAQKQGISLRGKGRQFGPADFQKFDLILAMDRENYADILALDFKGRYQDKVRLLCEFTSRFPDQEVPDPYYGGPDGFDYVIALLLDACEGLLAQVVEKEGVTVKPSQ